MKRAIYGTLVVFIGVLIIVWIVAEQHPTHPVKYENGKVVDAAK